MKDIPDEAIEAGARKLYDIECKNAKDGGATAFPGWDYIKEIYKEQVREVLAAVFPQ
jgi:hypothetical protein